MDVSIIITNYKSERHLSRCIQALQSRSDGSLFEIIIINNDTAPITSILPIENIRLIENGINEGFAKACNRGAKIAKGGILFFLNPDTELIKGNITDLLAALENKSVGIVAPQLTIPSGEIQKWSAGYEINLCNTIKNNLGFIKGKNLWEQNNIIEADWVSGAAFLIKKTLFDEISGFDENFFMYFEDVDLCRRVKEKNLSILVLPLIQVLHIGGQSFQNSACKKKYYYASQDYYFKKHFGNCSLFFLKLLRIPFLFFKKN
ncbi:MAG: glycosyl transferase family 2 [Candidatus Moranbacteria bacterium GW2011_GWC2_37_73]|nr:MAG: glycosyl transferase family protein [Parcubacteria group bacterium GW2011_GWC1_36_108]KKQ00234.1 MAG: glycosyl transferase family 2 [Candidatus Moranbacteria bacterium GW2011_GWD1_36_198]KKQ01362.1 MAG: glycosyl transferase family 2 [Candidatus Moranbacteria bacterium GW2011_GWD2_36_198]KKQ39259.1 MAG: glycosyl transferase family 2 [Candidatus Moranbacteria bacterium GW2011_GWC2_37_73]HAR99610.1 hypothetical protein [Candidatus Moranbacteria bacterium]